MSWKQYQNHLGNEVQKQKKKKRCTVLCLVFVGAFFVYQWADAISNPFLNLHFSLTPKEPFDISQLSVPQEAVNLGVTQIKALIQDRDVTMDLSINSELQAFIDAKLKKHRVDWAGVAVMEPDTGRVLALSSYSTISPDFAYLPLYAGFPAASIFKVVTASALLEETPHTYQSEFRYAGDMRKLHTRYLKMKQRGTPMSLSRAFAKSANGIFGVIGTQYLGDELLEKYANRFGFNEQIPFEFPVQISTLEHTDSKRYTDTVHTARLAAGFGKVTLSPLHGAMIASSIATGGQMMRPRLIDQAVSDGELLYQAQAEVWKTPFSSESAKALKAMMEETITIGTARRNFRGESVLNKLEMGGKTGSLTGLSPKGKNEWFVSYAVDPSTGKKIAVAVVLVNEKYWKIKPTQLTEWIFEEYFTQMQNTVASSIDPKNSGYDS